MHYWILLNTAAILGVGFYSGVMSTVTRKNTFARNKSIIEAKYGKEHREAFGEDTHINKFGYPDMGCNIYADLLPYKDWVTLNNAQRCHKINYMYTVILLPNAFISALCFPKFTCTLLTTFLFMRMAHIAGYHSDRGYNRAMLVEELMKLSLMTLVVGAMFSSARLAGFRPLKNLKLGMPKMFSRKAIKPI